MRRSTFIWCAIAAVFALSIGYAIWVIGEGSDASGELPEVSSVEQRKLERGAQSQPRRVSSPSSDSAEAPGSAREHAPTPESSTEKLTTEAIPQAMRETYQIDQDEAIALVEWRIHNDLGAPYALPECLDDAGFSMHTRFHEPEEDWRDPDTPEWDESEQWLRDTYSGSDLKQQGWLDSTLWTWSSPLLTTFVVDLPRSDQGERWTEHALPFEATLELELEFAIGSVTATLTAPLDHSKLSADAYAHYHVSFKLSDVLALAGSLVHCRIQTEDGVELSAFTENPEFTFEDWIQEETPPQRTITLSDGTICTLEQSDTEYHVEYWPNLGWVSFVPGQYVITKPALVVTPSFLSIDTKWRLSLADWLSPTAAVVDAGILTLPRGYTYEITTRLEFCSAQEEARAKRLIGTGLIVPGYSDGLWYSRWRCEDDVVRLLDHPYTFYTTDAFARIAAYQLDEGEDLGFHFQPDRRALKLQAGTTTKVELVLRQHWVQHVEFSTRSGAEPEEYDLFLRHMHVGSHPVANNDAFDDELDRVDTLREDGSHLVTSQDCFSALVGSEGWQKGDPYKGQRFQLVAYDSLDRISVVDFAHGQSQPIRLVFDDLAEPPYGSGGEQSIPVKADTEFYVRVRIPSWTAGGETPIETEIRIRSQSSSVYVRDTHTLTLIPNEPERYVAFRFEDKAPLEVLSLACSIEFEWDDQEAELVREYSTTQTLEVDCAPSQVELHFELPAYHESAREYPLSEGVYSVDCEGEVYNSIYIRLAKMTEHGERISSREDFQHGTFQANGGFTSVVDGQRRIPLVLQKREVLTGTKWNEHRRSIREYRHASLPAKIHLDLSALPQDASLDLFVRGKGSSFDLRHYQATIGERDVFPLWCPPGTYTVHFTAYTAADAERGETRSESIIDTEITVGSTLQTIAFPPLQELSSIRVIQAGELLEDSWDQEYARWMVVRNPAASSPPVWFLPGYKHGISEVMHDLPGTTWVFIAYVGFLLEDGTAPANITATFPESGTIDVHLPAIFDQVGNDNWGPQPPPPASATSVRVQLPDLIRQELEQHGATQKPRIFLAPRRYFAGRALAIWSFETAYTFFSTVEFPTQSLKHSETRFSDGELELIGLPPGDEIIMQIRFKTRGDGKDFRTATTFYHDEPEYPDDYNPTGHSESPPLRTFTTMITCTPQKSSTTFVAPEWAESVKEK